MKYLLGINTHTAGEYSFRPASRIKIFLFTALILPGFAGAQSKQSAAPPPPKVKNVAGKISFTIEGHLKDLKKRGIVHLAWQEPWRQGEFMKADVIDGKFTLKGTLDQPTSGYIRIVTLNDSLKPEQYYPWDCDRVSLYICNGKTTITGTDSLATAKLDASCKEYSLMKSFDTEVDKYTHERDSVMASLRNAYATKDSCGIKVLTKAYDLAQFRVERAYETFILQHPSSYLSVNLLNLYVYQAGNKKTYAMALALLSRLSDQMRSSPIAVAVKERIEKELYSMVGTAMPPLSLKDTSGSTKDVASFKSKLMLIDFWASWCSPCRDEFPRLLTLYEKYKDQGFEILGISIDSRRNDWITAIKKDKLLWPQLIDEGTGFGGKAGRLYGVNAVPAKFLVNEKGVIVAENVTLDQLEARLKALSTSQKKQ